MASNVDEVKRLLALEYEQVRSKIDTLDDMRFKIKGWCLTVAGGLLFLTINSGRAAICILALVGTCLFCYMEVIYISQEQILFDRSDYLEGVMESLRRDGKIGPQADSYVFGIRHAFREPVSRHFDFALLWSGGVILKPLWFYGSIALGILATIIVYVVR
jgi:hypothetical protein